MSWSSGCLPGITAKSAVFRSLQIFNGGSASVKAPGEEQTCRTLYRILNLRCNDSYDRMWRTHLKENNAVMNGASIMKTLLSFVLFMLVK